VKQVQGKTSLMKKSYIVPKDDDKTLASTVGNYKRSRYLFDTISMMRNYKQGDMKRKYSSGDFTKDKDDLILLSTPSFLL
jgi:hypothetical protein